MPEKGASKTGNGSNRIARRKRKNKKGWSTEWRGKGGLRKSGLATLSPRAGGPGSVTNSGTVTSLF